MQKSCPYCGRIHPIGAVCVKKPPRIRRRDESDAASYRNTGNWRRTRDAAKRRDLYICRVCLDRGEWNPIYRYIEVHHIIPIAENEMLRDELDNLITLCKRHHEDAEAGIIDRDYLRRLAKTEPTLLG